MYTYLKTYEDFREDIKKGIIVLEIIKALKRNFSESEQRAFKRSLSCVKNALENADIPGNVDVGIEFKVPLTNKRIDFVIAGEDKNSNKNVVIVELKQWNKVTHTDMNDIVLLGTEQHVHPSWQAYSYGSTISNFNEFVVNNNVNITTCTFLHDYEESYENEIKNEIYNEGLSKAPAFIEKEWVEFANFIGEKINKKSDVNLLWELENGRIKPSEMLVNSISKAITGNSDIELIDGQRIAKNNIKREVYKALADTTRTRKVIIVKGGAGTGKSLIALQLLGDFYKERGLKAFYVAKSSYIKEAYYKKITRDVPNYKFLRTLFRGSGDFHTEGFNGSKQFDCLIVDEAHRLTEKTKKSYLFYGHNQIQEIIHASLVTVFFIDETQQIDIKDFGTIENIKKAATAENAEVLEDVKLFCLKSQFRCNGSDDYINWVESLLYNKRFERSINTNDYEIKVYDNINEMYNDIKEKNEHSSNPSRMLSGDVFPWISMDDKNAIDINIDDFHAQWNKTKAFAVDPKSIDEVGCIHTSQGMEFEYIGLIVGKDLIYKNGKVETDYTKHPEKAGEFKRAHQRKILDEDKLIIDKLIRNTYKVLFTRGQKGLYLYVMDDELKEYIKEKIKELKNSN